MQRIQLSTRTVVALAIVCLPQCGESAPSEPRTLLEPAETSAEQPEDMLALLPAGLVGYVQVPSIGALNDAAFAVEQSFNPRAVRTDLLARLLGADGRLVDSERPLALALSLSDSELQMTYVLPALDVEALRAEASPTGASDVRGRYVALSGSTDYAPAGDTTALTRDLPGGVLSARFDLTRIIEASRTEIEMGMGLLQMQMAAVSSPNGMNMKALLAAYVDAFRGMLEAAEGLEFALREQDGVLGFSSTTHMANDSPFAGFKKVDFAKLTELARHVDGTQPIVMLGQADYGDLMERGGHFMQAVWHMYPETDEFDAEEAVAAFQAVFNLGDGSYAGDVSFDDGQMGLASYFGTARPEDFVSRYVQVIREGVMDIGGSRLEVLDDLDVDGHVVKHIRQTMDFEALLPTDAPPEQRAAARESMQALYGGDTLDVGLVAGPSVASLVMAAPGSDRIQQTVRQLAREDATLHPVVESLLAHVQGQDIGFALSVDVLKIVSMGQSMTAAAGGGSAMELMGSSNMTMILGATDGDWEFDFSFDFDGLAAAMAR
jgi:hypothetical protein